MLNVTQAGRKSLRVWAESLGELPEANLLRILLDDYDRLAELYSAPSCYDTAGNAICMNPQDSFKKYCATCASNRDKEKRTRGPRLHGGTPE